ncbi:MAG: YIP1 family protein [Candidatus Binatia bacterium]
MPAATTHATGPTSGPLLARLFNALLLRRPFYEAAAADSAATGPAAAMVGLAALAREIPTLYDISESSAIWGLAAFAIFLIALAGWVVYSAVAYLVARLLAPAPVEFTRVLRCLGYAETVTILRLLARPLDPAYYLPLHIALIAWTLYAVFVAMRAATAARGPRLWLIVLVSFIAQQVVLAIEPLLAY